MFLTRLDSLSFCKKVKQF